MAKKRSIAIDVTRVIVMILLYVTVIALVTVFLIHFCREAYHFSYQIFGEVVVSEPPGEDVTVEIQKGESKWEVAKQFEANHLVVNKYSFYIRLRLSIEGNRVLVPGKYFLNTSMT